MAQHLRAMHACDRTDPESGWMWSKIVNGQVLFLHDLHGELTERKKKLMLDCHTKQEGYTPNPKKMKLKW